MGKVTELDLNDKYDPKYSGLSLWIGTTAIDKQSIEIYIEGLLNMQLESLGCTLSKEDALLLANTIIEALK